jgi:hypothetical protein
MEETMHFTTAALAFGTVMTLFFGGTIELNIVGADGEVTGTNQLTPPLSIGRMIGEKFCKCR